MSLLNTTLILTKKISSALQKMAIRPKDLVTMGSLTLAFTMLESVGMGIIYLILGFLENGREGVIQIAPRPVAIIIQGMESIGIPLSLGALAATVALLLLIRQSINYFRTYFGMLLQIRGGATLHKQAAAKYLNADMSYYLFYNRTDIMYVAKLLSGRAAGLISIVSTSLGSCLLIIAYLLLLVTISPLSFFLLLPTLPMVLFAYRKTLTKGQLLGVKHHVALRAWVEHMHEAVNAVRLIKMRRMEASLIERINQLVDDEAESKKSLQRVNSMIEATILPLILLISVGILYIARTFAGMNFATLGIFALIVLRIAPQLSALGRSWAGLGNSMQALDEYNSGLATVDTNTKLSFGQKQFKQLKTGIKFDNVNFSYQTDSTPACALKGLSLEIKARSTTALVGPSGAGKSTLIDLLPEFIRPESGQVLFDGHPIAEYDIGTLRRGIALVSQDPVMFDDSIRNNIIFGVTAENEKERLQEVLEGAHCDFIKDLPDAENSRIGELGVRLSGGQRQRLALARALYQQPELLILDEPTSALDSASEVAIQASLDKLHGKITILIIAHRLSTVRQADIIHILERGEITASGTHDELICQKGLYATLFTLQTGQKVG